MRADRLHECIAALKECTIAQFDMNKYFHPDGTPACVAALHEVMFNRGLATFSGLGMHGGSYDGSAAMRYFDLNSAELNSIFAGGGMGCGGATTPAEAIAFIEKFIANNSYGMFAPPLEVVVDPAIRN